MAGICATGKTVRTSARVTIGAAAPPFGAKTANLIVLGDGDDPPAASTKGARLNPKQRAEQRARTAAEARRRACLAGRPHSRA